MKTRTALRTLVRWSLTALTVVGIAAHLYSARRAVTWDSQGLRYQIGLMLGSVYFSWRPPAWEQNTEHHSPSPGWCIASYAGSPKLSWWVGAYQSKSWHGISIPLWMPCLLLALPAAVTWYRDRALVRTRCRRWVIWLTPKQPKRLGFWIVVVFCVVHVLALIAFTRLFVQLYDFFFVDADDLDLGPDPIVWDILLASTLLLLSTPVWALLWACIYVRVLNTLFRRQPGVRCMACGYDLTGNVSGRCPECGRAIAESPAPKAKPKPERQSPTPEGRGTQG